MRRLTSCFVLVALFTCAAALAQSPMLPVVSASPRRALQQLTVVCVHYSPGVEPLRIVDSFSALTAEDIALLQKCVLNGTAEVSGTGIYEEGPKAKAILLLTGPVVQRVSAFQPWHTTAIYLQEGQSLVILPKDVAVFDKQLHLQQQNDARRYTMYLVDLTAGGEAGGSAGAWKP